MILLFILACLLGSIPSGVWIGKLFFEKDTRQHGGGNTETASTFRVLGKAARIAVLLMGILRGTLATCLPMISHLSGINPLQFGICAVLDYTSPMFIGFKGGKAVATSAEMLLGLNPVFSVYSCIILIVGPLCTSIVNLSSMIDVALVIFSTIVLPYVVPVTLAKPNWLLTIIASLVSSLIFYRHKDSIKRIKNHTGSRIPFGSNSNKERS